MFLSSIFSLKHILRGNLMINDRKKRKKIEKILFLSLTDESFRTIILA